MEAPRLERDLTAIYHLKVTVDGVYPPIWRRLAVAGATRLAELHTILQIAFGWEDYHLHQFDVLFDEEFGMGDLVLGQAAEDATLAAFAGREGARLRYLYDFGDNWTHTIVVERIARPAPRVTYPRCLAGARAAPPEDCGGPSGYMALLARRRPRKRSAGSVRRTAARRGFDPNTFARDEVNQALHDWQASGEEGESVRVLPPAPAPAAPPNRRYKLHIALNGIEPQIWRRLEAPGNVTLTRLHRLLQAAIGWEEIETHKFVMGERAYGPPGRGLGLRSSRAARLEQVAPEVGARFEYWYDLDPGWGHTILVEAIDEMKRPVRAKCLAGERAAPSADCADVADYLELLTALHKPRHRRHREAVEWVEWGYDPEACDLKMLNWALDKVR